MKRSEAINEIIKAISAFQGEITNAPKDSSNPYFKSSYTDLATVWDVIRKPLAKNGLALIQDASANGKAITITSLLAHTSGQWIEAELCLTAKDEGPQATGSCITYGRRYLAMALTGLAGEDDDGESATEHEPTKGKRVGEKPPIELVEEKPKTEGESYFSKIIAWMNTAKIADETKIKVLAEARKNKADEAALKEQYEKLSK